jgi:hypothetical protein
MVGWRPPKRGRHHSVGSANAVPSPCDIWEGPGVGSARPSAPTGCLVTVAAMSQRARLLGPAAAALVAYPLVGCGSSKPTLDTAPVQRAIAGSILTQRQVHTKVRCPSKVPRKAGVHFTCVASLQVGSYPVSVTETNGNGRVRYENSAPLVILNIKKVEDAITESILRQRHLRATVKCPAEAIQQAGVTFTCTATVGGKPYAFAVTEIDRNGRVRYVGTR